MCSKKSYKIRFSHGVGAPDTLDDLTPQQCKELSDFINLRALYFQLEKTYAFLVLNYRDYELFNYTVSLNNLLEIDEDHGHTSAKHGIDRHLTNLLTPAYTYTNILKTCKDDTESVLKCKLAFEKDANKVYEEHYEYMLLYGLRNKIHHGGEYEKSTWQGFTWSLEKPTRDAESDLIILKKEKRYSLFDVEMTREELGSILKKKKKYFDKIKESVPEKIHLRETIRVYVGLISQLHVNVRANIRSLLQEPSCIVTDVLFKKRGITEGTIIEIENERESELTDAVLIPMKNIIPSVREYRAPLSIKHHPMPGEHAAVPNYDDPV